MNENKKKEEKPGAQILAGLLLLAWAVLVVIACLTFWSDPAVPLNEKIIVLIAASATGAIGFVSYFAIRKHNKEAREQANAEKQENC